MYTNTIINTVPVISWITGAQGTTCTYLEYLVMMKYPMTANTHIISIMIPRPTPSPISKALSFNAVEGVSCVVVPVASVFVSNSTQQIRPMEKSG